MHRTSQVKLQMRTAPIARGRPNLEHSTLSTCKYPQLLRVCQVTEGLSLHFPSTDHLLIVPYAPGRWTQRDSNPHLPLGQSAVLPLHHGPCVHRQQARNDSQGPHAQTPDGRSRMGIFRLRSRPIFFSSLAVPESRTPFSTPTEVPVLESSSDTAPSASHRTSPSPATAIRAPSAPCRPYRRAANRIISRPQGRTSSPGPRESTLHMRPAGASDQATSPSETQISSALLSPPPSARSDNAPAHHDRPNCRSGRATIQKA
jgi:hypothetical protein